MTLDGTQTTFPMTPRAAARLTPVLAVGISFFVGNLDATVVNVATTQIGQELDATTTAVAWAVNGFVLALAALLMFGGDLAGRFGTRRIYVWGIMLFTVASMVAGFATTVPMLIGARVIQGVGAALFQPAGLVLLSASYPDIAVRQRMIGIWAAMGAAAAALGPMIGGFIVAGLGWQWIFWVNLPIGIVAICTSLAVLPEVPGRVHRVPLFGHLLFALVIAGGAVALMEGPEAGWSAPVPLSGIAVAVGALAGFVWWQRRSTEEVYPGRILGNRDFSLTNAVGVLLSVGLYGGVFLVSILLQQSLGSDPLTAGLQLLPMMIVFVIGNLSFSRLSRHMSARCALVIGMSTATIAVGVLALVSVQGLSYPWIAACLAIAHLCLGVAFPAMTAAMMNSIDPGDTGLAGAVLNVNRQLGSLVGVAIAADVLTAGTDTAAPVMFTVAAGGYALAAVSGFLLHRSPQPSQG